MTKTEFTAECSRAAGDLYDMLNNVEQLPPEAFNTPDTAVFVMDMVNGFAKAGALYSPRTETLIPGIRTRLDKTPQAQHIAFADTHQADSLEFASYPPHCVEGTEECAVVDELADAISLVIPKNSTNGFLEMPLVEWLHQNLHIQRYVVVGCCTDICVLQFAAAMQTFFVHNHMEKELIVPVNLVDTYDIPGVHSGELMQAAALAMLAGSGIRLVTCIK